MSEPMQGPAAGPAVATPPPAKPAPAKPAAAKPGAAPTRRGFLEQIGLSWLVLGWSSFILSMLGMLLYTVRFLFNNAPPQLQAVFRAGDVNGYESEVVDDKYKENGFWVIKHREGSKEVLYALSTICTHLGCNPNWLPGEKKFKCPCHGSGFYITGVNFEGPAPRPLERHAIKLEGNIVVVDKSRKFQKELGQWDDPESYLVV
ncbi:MAG: ubiquinol-cytochrome c reductase iron-sulfur subunit [Gemmataceae bacterium]